MKFERTDEFVNAHVVFTDKFLGVVIPGSFASTAWVELDPYRTMTGRVEVLWSDDAVVADIDRGRLTRVTSVEMFDEIINSGRYAICDLFKRWIEGDGHVKFCLLSLLEV